MMIEKNKHRVTNWTYAMNTTDEECEEAIFDIMTKGMGSSSARNLIRRLKKRFGMNK